LPDESVNVVATTLPLASRLDRTSAVHVAKVVVAVILPTDTERSNTSLGVEDGDSGWRYSVEQFHHLV
jgi:hypothetical protein